MFVFLGFFSEIQVRYVSEILYHFYFNTKGFHFQNQNHVFSFYIFKLLNIINFYYCTNHYNIKSSV